MLEGEKQQEVNWKTFRKLKVPPKIKLFLWKACMDCLLTRTRLRSRGMKLNDACVTCDAALESLMHIFTDCNFARECWRYNASNIRPRAMEGFSE